MRQYVLTVSVGSSRARITVIAPSRVDAKAFIERHGTVTVTEIEES